MPLSGESHHNAKLSDADVELIRDCYHEGIMPMELSEKFETPYWTIVDIVYHRTRT